MYSFASLVVILPWRLKDHHYACVRVFLLLNCDLNHCHCCHGNHTFSLIISTEYFTLLSIPKASHDLSKPYRKIYTYNCKHKGETIDSWAFFPRTYFKTWFCFYFVFHPLRVVDSQQSDIFGEWSSISDEGNNRTFSSSGRVFPIIELEFNSKWRPTRSGENPF